MAIVRRFFHGTTQENDAYVGPRGRFSFDTEKGTVRIHDGNTPGGFVVADTRDIENILYTNIHSGTVDGQDVTHPVDDEFGWRDLFSEIQIQGRGPNDPTWGPFKNGLFAYSFGASKLTECWTTFHIDHDYAIGTSVYPHVHWPPSTTASGTVRWGFEFTVAKGHNQGPLSVFGDTVTVYAEQTVNNQLYTHLITETSDANAIPADQLEPDSLILLRIFRDAENDTYPDPVFVFASDIHYQIARIATRNKAPNFFD